MRIRRFLHFILLLLAALMGWQVVGAWTTPAPRLLPPAPPSGQIGSGNIPLFRFPPPEERKKLAALIAEKDLFSPSRGQDEEEGEEGPDLKESVPLPDHLRLVGIVRLPEKQEAFLRDTRQKGQVIRVRVGEKIGEYRLIHADESSVVLMLPDGQRVSLELQVQKGAEAARAPRVPISRPAGSSRASSVPRVGEEEKALRQQIQQLHRRLREIRRQRIAAQRKENR